MLSLHAIRRERGKDTGEHGFWVGFFDTNDGGVGRDRPPAVEHAERRVSGEDADLRDAEGGGGVLAGGIVADIKARVGDVADEVGEGAIEEGDVRAGLRGGAVDTGGFIASGAA